MEYIVNVLQDQNDDLVNGTSLRDAINAANTNPGEDVIKFDPILNGDTIGLNLGKLDITDNLTITGDSTNFVTISGLGQNQIFYVLSNVNVTLNRLKIVNGNAGLYEGGGIKNFGNLTVMNSIITQCIADEGGGIFNYSDLTLINSTIYGNTAPIGGGIRTQGNATVLNSTISGNTGEGGISIGGNKSSIFNSTITSNSGGGVAINSTADVTTAELANSIVAGNIGTDVDILDGESGSIFTSLNGNLIGTGNAVGSFIQSKDQTGITDPLLDLLADNGGGNLTHALKNGSPAINNGVNNSLPVDTFDLDGDGDLIEPLPLDQLGGDRLQYEIVDIGAVESNTIYGDDNDNLLKGTASNNKINGEGGNDTLKGGRGNDSLNGGIGQDKLYGDRGKDTLTGGADNDILVGGKDKDSFLYATGQAFSTADVGFDKILDFTINADKIILSKTTFTAILSSTGKKFGVKRDFAVVSDDLQAASSKAYIIYNSDNGKLFYNENGVADGFGTGAKFADLSKQPDLTGNNFIIIE